MASKLKKKQEEYKKMRAGMKTGMTFSGKELFDFNPEWAQDGEDDGAMDGYDRDGSDHEGQENPDPTTTHIKVWGEPVQVQLDVFEGEDLEGLEDDDEDEA